MAPPPAWTPLRWGLAILAVTAAQAGVIFWLSDRRPPVSRPAGTGTEFHLVAQPEPGSALGEWLAVDDPTLLAVPSERGFSGPAWMRPPALEHRSADWTEPQRWLALPVRQLGADFAEFARTNLAGPRVLAEKPAPSLARVELAPVPLPARSEYRLEGGLQGRELVTPLDVPSLPHTEILTNTVVELGVAPSGIVFSAVPVGGGSGSKAADRTALNLARTVRFKPLPRAGGGSPAAAAPTSGQAGLTWGRIVFQWHTLEMPATNAPPGGPPP